MNIYVNSNQKIQNRLRVIIHFVINKLLHCFIYLKIIIIPLQTHIICNQDTVKFIGKKV